MISTVLSDFVTCQKKFTTDHVMEGNVFTGVYDSLRGSEGGGRVHPVQVPQEEAWVGSLGWGGREARYHPENSC